MTGKKLTSNLFMSNLSEIARKFPRDEKILVVNNHSFGQQVLETLSRAGTPWINFRVETVVSLAAGIAEEAVARAGLTRLTGGAVTAVVDDIFSRLDDEGRLSYFKRRTISIGIVEALASAVTELRGFGIAAGKLSESDFVDPDKAKDVKLILTEFDKILHSKAFVDDAGIIALGLRELEEKNRSGGEKYITFTRCYQSGQRRLFLEKLAGKGLIVLNDALVEGLSIPRDAWPAGADTLPAPRTDAERLRWVFKSSAATKPFNDGTIEIFSAIGIRNEVREMLRRISIQGNTVDDVEVDLTDVDSYGREIYCQCVKLGIPAAFAEGIPGEFFSPSRALAGFLRWMLNDFAESYIRQIIAVGDITPGKEKDGPGGSTLAHILKISGVGWGRDRYNPVLDVTTSNFREKAGKYRVEGEGDTAEYYEDMARHTVVLKDLCGRVLALVPHVDGDKKIDFKALCEGCTRFLSEFTRSAGENEANFINSAKDEITMLGELSGGRVLLENAVERIMSIVEGIRVGATGPKPGSLYITSYHRGGRSGRKNVFVMGLEEGLFPGRGIQDPILLDEERAKICTGMVLSAESISRNLFDMAGLISNLSGRVTFSYSSYDIRENRSIFPSSILLQVLRVQEHNPGADYSALFNKLGEAVAFNGGRNGAVPLDETDWWVNSLAGSVIHKDGMASVAGIYSGIKQGMRAESARDSDELTEYDGQVKPKGGELDPRKKEGPVVSATGLESAAKCPYRYFLAKVLRIEKPEEMVFDSSIWLNPMTRGSLMHSVYEDFANKTINEKTLPGRPGLKKILLALLDARVKEYTIKVPPPSEVVFENEYNQMKNDMEVFLTLIERLGTRQIRAELTFGYENIPPAEVPIGGGSVLRLHGSIDRLDRAGKDSEYHVWDYKTGGTYGFEEDEYISGGEHLQHGLYAEVAEQILRAGGDKKARVTKTGYIFPTEKGTCDGKGGVFERDTARKEEWKAALRILLDMISRGRFILSGGDCGYCDYSEICGDGSAEKRLKEKAKNPKNKILADWQELKDYE